MTDDNGDEELHPRLMMLSEFDGEIEGRLILVFRVGCSPMRT